MAPLLNICFKLFMFFCTEIGLLPERQVEPLEVLVRLIQKKYSIQVRMYKEIGDANYDDPKSSILPDLF